MTLNAQVQALLDQMAENPMPSITELPAPEARALFAAMAENTDPKGIPIGKVEDLTIPGPAGDLPVRLYTPIAAAPVGPALVFYHGGGWVIGNVDTHDALCRQLANESGARVISVDYRLAPEHPFPAAVEDAFVAVKWVQNNAMDLDVDPNAIAVGGDSAGGNLAAVVTQMARKGGVRIAFQLLIYPVTEALADTASMNALAEGFMLEKASMEWFVGQYVPAGTTPKDPRISPLLAEDLSGLPPAYLVTAGYDPLKDEGRAYAEKLQAAGVTVEHVNYEAMIHGFFTMTGIVDEAREAVEQAGAALKAGLAS